MKCIETTRSTTEYILLSEGGIDAAQTKSDVGSHFRIKTLINYIRQSN